MTYRISSLLGCTLGPSLYAFFNNPGRSLTETSTRSTLSQRFNHRNYQPNQLETFSEYIINLTNAAFYVGIYASPVMFSFMLFKRTLTTGLITVQNGFILIKVVTTLFSLLVGAMLMRGLGRYQNPSYTQFCKVLREAQRTHDPAAKRALNRYDFDFRAWPVDYQWTKSSLANRSDPPSPYKRSYPACPIDELPTPQTFTSAILNLPIELVASIAMHTFGRRIVYPGTLSLLQKIMNSAILSGRAKLVEDLNGMRYKLESYTGHAVDCMYVDRRDSAPNGDTLVIGCEGNGGFYEIGTIFTPLEAGYSVLGWNHPGYGGSSGLPYPDNEVAAVDIVVKFAIEKLGFPPEKIIMYGWSIGGFTASWAAMRYPKICGVVLDATFDNLEPLALAKMPTVISRITKTAIRKYFDLNNVRHLHHYDGPVLLIRRSHDEIISEDPENSMPTNRANDLLIELLKSRFPVLMSEDRLVTLVRDYLSGDASHQEAYLRRYSVNSRTCMSRLYDYFHLNRTAYPVNIGDGLDRSARDQLVLFLASKHLVDHESVHTAPLPASYFTRPWDLITTALRSSSL